MGNFFRSVYADPTEYEIEKEGKKNRRIPDIYFISYETASEQTQNSWLGYYFYSSKYGYGNCLGKRWKKFGCHLISYFVVCANFLEKSSNSSYMK